MIGATVGRLGGIGRQELQYGGFNPLSLFTGGLVGAVSDATDMSQLGSTTAGVGGITGVGDDIAFMRNQAMANHFVQGTVGSRPKFGSYTSGGQARFGILFDGLDDFLASQSLFALSGSSKLTIVAGIRKDSGELGGGVIAGLGNATTTNGTLEIRGPSGLAANNYSSNARGSSGVIRNNATPASYAPPLFNVVTAEIDFAASTQRVYVDGVLVATNTAALGGNLANSVLHLGSRVGASFFFKGFLLRKISINEIYPSTTRNAMESWAREKSA